MKRYLSILSTALILLASVNAQGQYIYTIAGTPNTPGYGGDGGLATNALMYSPSDIAIDSAGNLYVTDFINNVIRKIDTGGIITTIAGTGFGSGVVSTSGTGSGGYTGDLGQATAAELNGPFGITLDPSGNIYFADGYNHVVRKIDTAGIITTIAGNHLVGYFGDDSLAIHAQLDNPVGVAFDKAGNLYIADDHNNAIRKVDGDGIITTFAGNHTAGYSGDGGPATLAAISDPRGVGVDYMGNVYIADADNNVVRMVDTSGIIHTYAGIDTAGYTGDGGQATAAKINSPARINFDAANNVYISDFYNNIIRIVSPAGIITTYAGNGYEAGTSPILGGFSGDGGPATAAELYVPSGIVFNQAGIAFFCDRGNEIIREIGPMIYNNVGVNSLANSAPGMLTLYPNPSQAGNFTFELTSSTAQYVDISIMNVLGQTVKNFGTTTNRAVVLKLNAPPGLYFLYATTATGKWTKQIIVE